MQDAMTDEQLRAWAEQVKDHSAAARGVLRLLAYVDELVGVGAPPSEAQVDDLVKSQLNQMQQDKLSDMAHKPFDGSTGTPADGVAGHKSESQL